MLSLEFVSWHNCGGVYAVWTVCNDLMSSFARCGAENSSPEALSEMARNVGQDLSDATLEERRARLSDFVKESNAWPSDSEIMNTTLQLIANRSEPEATRIQGLKMLQGIVEDTLLANGADLSIMQPRNSWHVELATQNVYRDTLKATTVFSSLPYTLPDKTQSHSERHSPLLGCGTPVSDVLESALL